MTHEEKAREIAKLVWDVHQRFNVVDNIATALREAEIAAYERAELAAKDVGSALGESALGNAIAARIRALKGET